MSKAKINVKFTKGGFEKLRKTPEVRDDLKKRAEAIAKGASENGRVEGYIVTELLLEDPRGAVSIMATGHARRHNNKTHALLKNMDKGRD